MADIQAHLRFLSISAQKVRLVVDLVRGKKANDALEILRFVPNRAAEPIRKLHLAGGLAIRFEEPGICHQNAPTFGA